MSSTPDTRCTTNAQYAGWLWERKSFFIASCARHRPHRTQAPCKKQYPEQEQREIAPAADATERTYDTRVALGDDATKQVELGQSARVYIREGDAQAAALAIPLSAIQRGAGGTTSVWVVDPRTRTLASVAVRLGPFGESRVPVIGGLDARDWVVTAGGHLLRAGQRVEPVDRDNRPVLPPPAAPAPATAAK